MGIAATLAENAQTLINFATFDVSVIPLTSANVTLTLAEINTTVVKFTGELTANIQVTFPSIGLWTVYNDTTGDYTVTLTNGAGATFVLNSGSAANILSNTGTGIITAGSGGSGGAGVLSFDGRTGVVTLQASDVTGVGGALLASPAFTGTPTSVTPAAGSNNTDIATTAFVAASYAPLASPALTGVPTAPTATSTSTDTTQIATTAFVQSVVSTVANGLDYMGTWNAETNTPTLASGVGTTGQFYKVSVAGTTDLDGNSTWNVGDIVIFAGTAWQDIPAQASDVYSFNSRTGAITLEASDVTTALGFTPANVTALAAYAPLASPTFTGLPSAPTAAAGTNSTQIATTAFVSTSFAPIVSPAFSGTPTAPTAANGTSTTQLATTAFVQNSMGSFAPVASPAFTGTPTAPTAVAGTSTTQLATTAFVATSYAQIASPSFTGRVQSPSYSYTVQALGSVSGAHTLDLSAASEFTMTITGATTLAFTNTLAVNTSEVVIIRFTNAGSAVVTWPTGTQFAAKTAPTFTASGIDVVGVVYDTTTSTYMVFVIGLNVGV